MVQVEGMDARARALADDQVDRKSFHGGIDSFLNGGLKAMNFVEEEDFLGFEGSEDCREIAFAFEERAGAGFDRYIQLVGNGLRESSLAEALRTIEQNVIEGFTAIASGFESDGDVLLDALLANVFGERFRANTGVETGIVIPRGAGDHAG